MERSQSQYLSFAIDLARESGDILMKNHGKSYELEWKKKHEFRTKVDKEVDGLIRRRISENFPYHNIISEENEAINKDSEFTWICDPLDGTTLYTSGISDHFSVCLSLVKEKTPLVGVINAVGRGELYSAESGKGAFCNDNPIKVSLEENVNHILMGFDAGKETAQFWRRAVGFYLEQALSKKGIACPLMLGCASLSMALTASGKMHAYSSLNLEPWDMAAGVIISREAGAKVTNMLGGEWTTDDNSVLVANPIIHQKLLALFVK